MGDPIGNDIRLGVNAIEMVHGIVAEEECSLKACQCTANRADGASFLEPGFILSIVALKEEDGMWVR